MSNRSDHIAQAASGHDPAAPPVPYVPSLGIGFAEAFGHSIMYGAGGSFDPESGFFDRACRTLGIPRRRNLAIGGAIACWPNSAGVGDGGYPTVLQAALRPGSAGFPAPAAPYVPRTQLAFLYFGLNDLAALGSAKPLPFQTALRTMMSRIVSSVVFEDDNAAFARTGAWTPLQQVTSNSGPQIQFTSTVNDHVTFTLPADYPGGRVVALGIWLNSTWAQVTYGIKVDGVARPDLVLNPAALTDQNVASKHTNYCLRLGTGAAGDPALTPGAHTIDIALKAGPVLAYDYAQIETDPLDGPILVMPLTHKPSSYSVWNTWPHGPNAGSDPMNNAAVDSWKASQRVVQAEFPGRVIEVDLDPLGITTANGHVIADGVHPNDRGHGVIAAAIVQAVLSSPLITERVRNRPTPAMRPSYKLVGAQGSNAAFAANWANQSSPVNPLGFRKDERGMVKFKGACLASTGAGTTIFTLPPGYRPSETRTFTCPYNNGAYNQGVVRVNSDGTVVVLSPAVANAQAWQLSGIEFDAEVWV